MAEAQDTTAHEACARFVATLATRKQPARVLRAALTRLADGEATARTQSDALGAASVVAHALGVDVAWLDDASRALVPPLRRPETYEGDTIAALELLVAIGGRLGAEAAALRDRVVERADVRTPPPAEDDMPLFTHTSPGTIAPPSDAAPPATVPPPALAPVAPATVPPPAPVAPATVPPPPSSSTPPATVPPPAPPRATAPPPPMSSAPAVDERSTRAGSIAAIDHAAEMLGPLDDPDAVFAVLARIAGAPLDDVVDEVFAPIFASPHASLGEAREAYALCGLLALFASKVPRKLVPRALQAVVPPYGHEVTRASLAFARGVLERLEAPDGALRVDAKDADMRGRVRLRVRALRRALGRDGLVAPHADC